MPWHSKLFCSNKETHENVNIRKCAFPCKTCNPHLSLPIRIRKHPSMQKRISFNLPFIQIRNLIPLGKPRSLLYTHLLTLLLVVPETLDPGHISKMVPRTRDPGPLRLEPRPGPLILHRARDPKPRTLKERPGKTMIGETRDPKLTSLVEL